MCEDFPACYDDTHFIFENAPEPLPEAFAIITAHHPMNRRWSRKMNRAADLRLRRLLERKLIRHFRATGQSSDGSHAEPGWAVTAPLEQALAISHRFKQFALWWVEDGDLHLIRSDGRLRKSLGPLAPRVR